jgi:chromosome segregation protein
LVDWLQGTYLLGSDDDPEDEISKLALGETLVNQHGDIFSRNSMSYHSAQSSLHGVLERQAQLELLKKNQPKGVNEKVLK